LITVSIPSIDTYDGGYFAFGIINFSYITTMINKIFLTIITFVGASWGQVALGERVELYEAFNISVGDTLQFQFADRGCNAGYQGVWLDIPAISDEGYNNVYMNDCGWGHWSPGRKANNVYYGTGVSLDVERPFFRSQGWHNAEFRVTESEIIQTIDGELLFRFQRGSKRVWPLGQRTKTAKLVIYKPVPGIRRSQVRNIRLVKGDDQPEPTDIQLPNVDSDGDGFNDSVELAAGHNPNDPLDFGPINIEKTEYTYPTATRDSEFEINFTDNVQSVWNVGKLGSHPENYFRIMIYNNNGRFIDAIRKNSSGKHYIVDGKIKSISGSRVAVSKGGHQLKVLIAGDSFVINLDAEEFYRGSITDNRLENGKILPTLIVIEHIKHAYSHTTPKFSETINNEVPIADAGAAQKVNAETVVTLNGNGSRDPDNTSDNLKFFWTAPAGILLSSYTGAQPNFQAPEVSKNTTYEFALIVNDGKLDSVASTVTVTVVPNANPIGPMFVQGPEFPKRGARGQSAAVVDYDSDGYVDIINGLEVYRNNGNSTFTKVSDVPESPTLSPSGRISGHGTITAWADFDNDGIRDVLVFGSDFWGSTSAGGHDRLRDRIHKVTLDDQGIPSYGSHHDIKGYDASFTTSYPAGAMKFDYCQNSTWGVALSDINLDGKVDIYLGRGRIGNLDGAHEPEYYGLDWLIENNLSEHNWNYYDGENGPNSATLDVTNIVGMKPSDQKVGDSYQWAHKGYRHTEPVGATDYDFDGAPDFFVGNYRVFDNYLWEGSTSGGSFKFINTSNQEGIHNSTKINLDNISGTHHGGGALWFDYDNDGDLDLIEARLSHYNASSSLRLWRNNGDGTFSNTTNTTMPLKPSGFNSQHYKSVTAGDYDNDGDLDLYVTRAGQGGGETAFNRGRFLEYQSKVSKFVDVTALKGLANRDHFDTFGTAFLDYNNDGNLDLLTTQGWTIAESGKTEIWRNNGNSTGNHLWVNLSPPKKYKSNPLKTATPINPDGIGTIVQLWIDKDNDGNRESGEILTRQQSGNCTGSMWIGPQPLHFGLGDYDEDDIKWIRILWPGISALDVNAWQYAFALSTINTTVDLPRKALTSALIIEQPKIASNGNLVLKAKGPVNSKVLYQFTDDLINWNTFSSDLMINGKSVLSLPIPKTGNSQLFFRVMLEE
jgi:hypothetical protein